LLVVTVLMLPAGGLLRADLEAVMAERNLEKRSQKAIKNAEKALEAARKAYRTGAFAEVETALKEVLDSVDLCYRSLQESGKNPRRSPKYFKRAEIHSRKLLRLLNDFRQQMSYTEREQIEALIKRVRQVQSDLLAGIMGSKRWEQP